MARLFRALLGVLLGVALIVVAVPAFTGRPILSYPVSESMVPTLGPFDVFLIDPFPGRIDVGDIIVFDSVVRGGAAVHRVVAIDEHGYTTRGDANPDVDQMNGEPPVPRAHVLGRVMTGPTGAPLVLRNVGVLATEVDATHVRLADAVGGASRLAAYAFLGLAAVLVVPAFLNPRRRTRLSRPSRTILKRVFPRGVRGHHVGLTLLVLLVAGAVLAERNAMSLVDTSLVVVKDPTAADPVRATVSGSELPRNISVSGSPFLPMLVIADPASEHIRSGGANARVPPGKNATVRVHEVAGDAPGYQEDHIAVWHYPAILPDAWTIALHRALPGSPIMVLAGIAVGVGWVWYSVLGISRRPVGRWLGLREEWL